MPTPNGEGRLRRRDRLSAVWAGVGVAAALALGFAAILTFTSNELSDTAEEAFAGIMSVLAVALVTSMVFWMRRNSHRLRGELQSKVDGATQLGWFGVFFMAFVTVGREGLETALFLWPTVKSAGSGTGPLLGVVIGLAISVILGWAVYRRSVHLNLATFFRITGAALIVIAAGVLAYGIHDLQEIGALPGAEAIAFDVSAQIPPTSWYGTLLKGTFSFTPETSWLQLIG